MAKNVGDFALATVGVGEQVPILVNGLPVHNIFQARNTAGDLSVNLHVEGLQAAAPAAPATPAATQPEEPEPPVAAPIAPSAPPDPDALDDSGTATGALQAGGEPIAQDLGDQGSEDDAL